MVSRNQVGIDPKAPLDYVGAQYSFLPCYQAPRRPLPTDHRVQFSLWRVGSFSATQPLINGVTGECWQLSYYNSIGQAIWVMLTNGTNSGIQSIIVPSGTTPVVPTNIGQVTFTSTGGTVSITGSTNSINFDVTGGAALDSLQVDANTAPGTNPVLPTVAGLITVQGGATYATNTRTKPIRTNSLALNSFDLEVQLAGSNASTASSTKFGVSQFDANQFTVTSGFVQLVNTSYFTSIVIQSFTANATYTPTAGMKYCIIEAVGGGGGGGGCPLTGVAEVAAGGGGGGGGYARGVYTAATVGASQAVTIGAGGAGGIGNAAGSSGTNSTVGALIVGGGGAGGGNSIANAVIANGGGDGGTGSGGSFFARGGAGQVGHGVVVGAAAFIVGGTGGSSYFGGMSQTAATTSGAAQGNGNAGVTYGSGGCGAISSTGGTAANGGAGAAGLVVITEFI